MQHSYSLIQHRVVLVLSFLIPFLLGTGVDLYIPSLPVIAHYFKASPSDVQWTVSIYMLGYGVSQLFWGILSDGLGRKKILWISAVSYTLVSFLSAFSPTIDYLIFYRLGQGLSIGGMAVIGRAILTDSFSGLALSKSMNCFSLSWSIGPIIAPFIGGYLQHYFNWQANFYFFGTYGVLILIYMIWLTETHTQLLPLCLKHICQSIKMMLTHKLFLLYSVLCSLTYAFLVVFNMIAPFLIEDVMRYSVLQYGYIALLLGLAYFLGNLSNRILINYIDPKKILFLGVMGELFFSIALLILIIFIKLNLYIIFIPVWLLFFFGGWVMPNGMAECARFFPKIAGSAMAVCGTLCSVGVFMLSSIATHLKTSSPVALALLFTLMSILEVFVFLLIRRRQ